MTYCGELGMLTMDRCSLRSTFVLLFPSFPAPPFPVRDLLSTPLKPLEQAEMGFLRKLKVFTGIATGVGAGALGYLGASTTVISPLPHDDPLWRSSSHAKYNLHQNPSTQDICIKRIPLSKIKPELLQNEGDLALEFCRGVWGGLGETRRSHSKEPRMLFGIASPLAITDTVFSGN